MDKRRSVFITESIALFVSLAFVWSGCSKRVGVEGWGPPPTPVDPCVHMGGLQADAPWPMWGRCPARSFNSPHLGPAAPEVRWSVPDLTVDGLAIDAQGRLYVNDSVAMRMTALDSDGGQRWSVSVDDAGVSGPYSTPLIGEDGTIHVLFERVLVALGPDGAERWRWAAPAETLQHLVHRTEEGVVVVGSGDQVFGIETGGTFLWQTGLVDFADTSPVLSPAGELLHAVWLGMAPPYPTYSISSLTPAGAEEELGTFEALSADVTAIDSLGTVYAWTNQSGLVGKQRLTALAYDGVEQWVADFGAETVGPAIGADGTLYIIDIAWDRSHQQIIALTPAGDPLWDTPAEVDVYGSLLVDGNGAVYFAGVGSSGESIVTSLDIQGQVRWRLPLPPASGSTPRVLALDAQQTLYVGTDHSLVALGRQE